MRIRRDFYRVTVILSIAVLGVGCSSKSSKLNEDTARKALQESERFKQELKIIKEFSSTKPEVIAVAGKVVDKWSGEETFKQIPRAISLGTVNCTLYPTDGSNDARYYVCSLTTSAQKDAPSWEKEETADGAIFRAYPYDPKVDSINISQAATNLEAEAILSFRFEPNEFGHKLRLPTRKASFTEKALFKKYNDGWKLDRIDRKE